jgi:2-dehydropantoate 2-reductase
LVFGSGSMRLLIVGCGGLGGTVAGYLARTGHDVSIVTTNAGIAQAIQREGLRVRFAGGSFRARVALLGESPGPATEPFDVVLLATQPNQVEDATRLVLPWLTDRGRVVCFQNGLCEERVARLVGEDRVVGAVVFWGASMPEPGLAQRTSAGGFALGRLDREVDEPLRELATLLGCLGPIRITTNLRGVRWSKLAVNCAMSTFGTIGGESVGVLMRRQDARQLGIEAISEAVQVARRAGVRLEKPAGWIDLGWLVVDSRARENAMGMWIKHAMVLAAVTPYRRLRSSMLAAIERGRPPAVDFLNGEVIDRAEQLDIPVPINRAARALVWAIARGEARPSVQTLHALYERTRPGGGQS